MGHFAGSVSNLGITPTTHGRLGNMEKTLMTRRCMRSNQSPPHMTSPPFPRTFFPGFRLEGAGSTDKMPGDRIDFMKHGAAGYRITVMVKSEQNTPSGGLVYELPSILEPLRLEVLFPSAQPLEVELGCGDGSFLMDYAEAHPDRNFLGVERLLGRIRKLDRKGRRRGLTNLRGVRIECSYFLKFLLPPNSADRIHVYFPDPWPKERHHRRRLVNSEFPALAQAALRPGGTVHLRTDDTDYFEQMQDVFGQAAEFEPTDTPVELVRVLTDFEKHFQTQGVNTLRAAFKLKG